MRYKIISLLVVLTVIIGLFAVLSDNTEQEVQLVERKPYVRDLDQIREDGVLRAITTYSMTSYFLYRGEPMGFEYELLQRLATELGVKLEIVIADDMDDMIGMLNRGEGDIIAYGLAITDARKQDVEFTHHHYTTHQVLVQRKPDGWQKMPRHKIDKKLIRSPLDLIGKTVSVRRSSSYSERLQHMSKEMGGAIFMDTMPGSLSTEDIIKMVSDGKLDYTIADENIASINQTYYPDLDVKTQVSLEQRIAWPVRCTSPQLKQAVDDWVRKMSNKSEYYVIYNKYFKYKKSFNRRVNSELFSMRTGKISQYDGIVKEHSKTIGWDWRLISSQIYQESKFNNEASSWSGAMGLMQIMPETAADMGVYDLLDPNANVAVGTAYLEQLWYKWKDIPDSLQRIKFTMASYNCGYGHVRDAQRLAVKYCNDRNTWDANVDGYLRLLSQKEYFTDPVVRYGYVRGEEPYRYVMHIFERYEHYCRFIDAEDNSPKLTQASL